MFSLSRYDILGRMERTSKYSTSAEGKNPIADNTTTYYTFAETPVGTVLFTGNGQAIAAMYWKVFKRTPLVRPDWIENRAPFEEIIRQLDEYFAGKRDTFDLVYEVKGTDFQKSVWRELAKIPYGKVSSYKEIAAAVGRPGAVRAVGTAIGSNPLSIVIPCHRVLGSSGQLCGYAGGLPAKARLLQIEGVEV